MASTLTNPNPNATNGLGANNGTATMIGANAGGSVSGMDTYDSFDAWMNQQSRSGGGGGLSSYDSLPTYGSLPPLTADQYGPPAPGQAYVAQPGGVGYGNPMWSNQTLDSDNYGSAGYGGLADYDQGNDLSAYAMAPRGSQGLNGFDSMPDAQDASYDSINSFIKREGQPLIDRADASTKNAQKAYQDFSSSEDARLEQMQPQIDEMRRWADSTAFAREVDLQGAMRGWDNAKIDHETEMRRMAILGEAENAESGNLRDPNSAASKELALNRQMRDLAAAEGNLRAEYAPIVPNREGGAGIDGLPSGVATMDFGGEKTAIGKFGALDQMPDSLGVDNQISTDVAGVDPMTGYPIPTPQAKAEMEKAEAEAQGLNFVDIRGAMQTVNGARDLSAKTAGLMDWARAAEQGGLTNENMRRAIMEKAQQVLGDMGAVASNGATSGEIQDFARQQAEIAQKESEAVESETRQDQTANRTALNFQISALKNERKIAENAGEKDRVKAIDQRISDLNSQMIAAEGGAPLIGAAETTKEPSKPMNKSRAALQAAGSVVMGPLGNIAGGMLDDKLFGNSEQAQDTAPRKAKIPQEYVGEFDAEVRKLVASGIPAAQAEDIVLKKGGL